MNQNKKVLITGCNGFVGKWLSDYLITRGFEVYGVDIQEKTELNFIHYTKINILEIEKITDLIDNIKPYAICHLAGVTYLPDFEKTPPKAMEINIIGTMGIFEAVKTLSLGTKIVVVGSSKIYGNIKSKENIREDFIPSPSTFYGISKYASELIGKQYVERYGLDIKFTRSFNHTGPGQSPLFVCSDWAKQVANIMLKRESPFIKVGKIDKIIDISDVRDVVRAYHLIIEKGRRGEIYNVCSGRGVELSYILKYLLSKAEIPISIMPTEEKKRGFESESVIIGSYNKLKEHTGWEPQFSIEKTLDDLIEYWLREIK
ncbi:MAG: GDP-mannose 4,6-dehydratase [Chitinispirillaceae bacterium]|nr:GDP-mannose 4,6-dehydratase [Chitinispirillaceae bacterium]